MKVNFTIICSFVQENVFGVSEKTGVCYEYLLIVDVFSVIKAVDDYHIVFNTIDYSKGCDT